MTKQTTLTWGILGAARINQQLLPAIATNSSSRLLAIASRRPGAAAETLANFAPDQQDIQVYAGLNDILEDKAIQAVYIPLSNHEHAKWTLKAIEHGKHVLCEKPMALQVAEIDAIAAAAKQHNVTVMEGFMYRNHPQHQRVKEIIATGAIGEVRIVRSSFAFMLQPARLYRIKEPITNGGGAMWDIGCYAIHAARFPFDSDPVAITAMANYTDNGADLSSCGIMDFCDGKYAQFEFSFEHARRAEYEIIGSKGGLKCHNVWAKQAETPVISWWTEAGGQNQESLSLANHFQLEIAHFVDCVLHGQTPILSLADARMNCQIINAAITSAAEGRRVELELA